MNNIFVMNDNKIDSDKDILIIESKTGLPLIKFKGFYLNSKYDPIKEAKRLANHFYKKNHAHILFGLGYSYLAEEVLKKMGESDFLLIVEPNISLFEKVKNKVVLGPLANHNRVFFIIGYEQQQVEEEIKYLVNQGYMAQIELIISPNYDKLYPQYISNIEEIIKKNVKLSVVNLNTITFFSNIWQKNLLYNLYNSWKSMPFVVFKNKFTCPVIIVASGPSLTKQLEELRKIKEKKTALIIAAGSTINPLLQADIKPDIIVTIDGGEGNWHHFKNVNYDDIPLFYSLEVHKDIPKNHKGFKVAFNTGDSVLSTWINKTIGKEMGFVAGGASVANFCLYIAKVISSGPITLIGQDLAYTNNFTHAEGNKHFMEINEENYGDRNKYVNIKGYYGDEVISDYQFLSMKRVFEDMVTAFREHGDKRAIFNSTEGGALIEGIPNLEFKNFINTYCNTNYGYEFNEAFKPYLPDYEQKERIKTSIEIEQKNLQKVNNIVEKAINILEGTSRESIKVDAKIIKRLDKIDIRLSEYTKSSIIYYITMPINFRINHLYQEGLNETPLEQTKRILNKSEALYRSIKEAVEDTLKIVESILNTDS